MILGYDLHAFDIRKDSALVNLSYRQLKPDDCIYCNNRHPIPFMDPEPEQTPENCTGVDTIAVPYAYRTLMPLSDSVL